MAASYYVTRIALVIWGLCIVASAPQWLNAQIPHTHFHGSPGAFFSLRNQSKQAVSLALAGTRIFQVLAVCGFLTFRDYSSGAVVFWTIIMAALVTLDTIALSINGSFLHNCNKADVANAINPCNAPNWCCAPEVYTMALPHCRNNAACPVKSAVTSVAQLGKRGNFVCLFSINVLFVAAGVVMVALMTRVLYAKARGELKNVERSEAKLISDDSRKDR